MKKIVAIILTLVMIFALCSCGKDDNQNIASNSNINASENSEVSSADSDSQSSVPTEESKNNNSSNVSTEPENNNSSEDTSTNSKNPSSSEGSSSSSKKPTSSSSSSSNKKPTSSVSSSTSSKPSSSNVDWCRDCIKKKVVNKDRRCAECQGYLDSGLVYCTYRSHYVESLYGGTRYCIDCNREIMTPPEYTPPDVYYCSNCGRQVGTDPGMCDPYNTGIIETDKKSENFGDVIWECRWY